MAKSLKIQQMINDQITRINDPHKSMLMLQIDAATIKRNHAQAQLNGLPNRNTTVYQLKKLKKFYKNELAHWQNKINHLTKLL